MKAGPRVTLAVVCAALAATAASLSPSGRALADALVADGRVAIEPWRLATGPLVHATWWHLARDAALVLALGLVYEERLGARWPWIVALGLVAPPLAVIAGGDAGYYGLSGLAHAMIAAALACELEARRGRARAVVAAIAMLFAAKVVYEAAAGGGAAASSILPRAAWLDLGARVHQAPVAHLAGALSFAIVTLAATGLEQIASRMGESGELRLPRSEDAKRPDAD
jgi:membrane associated rhomboid family serine protease